MSAAEAMSDEICVQSKSTVKVRHVQSDICVYINALPKVSFKVHISDTDILACCGTPCRYGYTITPIFTPYPHSLMVFLEFRCEGGWPIQAYRFMEREGVCTGGRYRQKVRWHVTVSSTVDSIIISNT